MHADRRDEDRWDADRQDSASRRDADRQDSAGGDADRKGLDHTGDSKPPPRPFEDPSTGVEKWVTHGVIVLVGLALAFLAYQAAASFLPRWWSQRIGNQVGGSFSSGTLWGLFYGFLFTLVPVLLLFQARRSFLKVRGRIAVVVVSLLLAAPNWMTLFVVLGNSKAANAGERILDVDAPAFRWATLIGAIAGLLVAVALSGMRMWLKHRRHQVRDLRGQLKTGRDKPTEGSDPTR